MQHYTCELAKKILTSTLVVVVVFDCTLRCGNFYLKIVLTELDLEIPRSSFSKSVPQHTQHATSNIIFHNVE